MTAGIAYSAALLLAAVLAWAALAKARRPGATAATFRALHLPAPRVLAVIVPTAEAVTAALLIAAPRTGAAAALVLLAAFTLLLSDRIRRGAAVACGCFGSSRNEPASSVDFVRNGLLAAAGVTALGAPGPVLPSLAAVVATSAAGAAGLVVLALAGLRRQTGTMWGGTRRPA